MKEDTGMSNQHRKRALNFISCKEMQFEINERSLHTIVMAKIENCQPHVVKNVEPINSYTQWGCVKWYNQNDCFL